jgi:hypothetical protein
MQSSTISQLTVAANSPASTAVPADRESAPRLAANRATLKRRAENELETYFARTRDAGPRTTARDHAVAATLASISAYHRGVLTLYYDARTWPDEVTKALGEYASIGVRLNCADHPAVGSTPTLERAAAQRIVALVTVEGSNASVLVDLWARAAEHHDRALRAYVKALRAREER